MFFLFTCFFYRRTGAREPSIRLLKKAKRAIFRNFELWVILVHKILYFLYSASFMSGRSSEPSRYEILLAVEACINSLIEMGFDRSKAFEALESTRTIGVAENTPGNTIGGYSLARATDW